MLAREVVKLPASLTHSAYSGLRQCFRRLGFLRSAWYLATALRQSLVENPALARERFDGEFARQADPWGYAGPRHQERLQRAAALLDGVRGARRFHSALEIGCGEGWFTELLAERCESLLAVDISAVALRRARERCRGMNHVQLAWWDLWRGRPPGVFDLVTAMDVLECFPRPGDMRVLRTRITDLVASAGFLLITTTKQHPVVESAWWGRWLIRGKHINEFFAAHPALTVCSEASTDTHVLTLYGKAAGR